jgi:hypothetical protein
VVAALLLLGATLELKRTEGFIKFQAVEEVSGDIPHQLQL